MITFKDLSSLNYNSGFEYFGAGIKIPSSFDGAIIFPDSSFIAIPRGLQHKDFLLQNSGFFGAGKSDDIYKREGIVCYRIWENLRGIRSFIIQTPKPELFKLCEYFSKTNGIDLLDGEVMIAFGLRGKACYMGAKSSDLYSQFEKEYLPREGLSESGSLTYADLFRPFCANVDERGYYFPDPSSSPVSFMGKRLRLEEGTLDFILGNTVYLPFGTMEKVWERLREEGFIVTPIDYKGEDEDSNSFLFMTVMGSIGLVFFHDVDGDGVDEYAEIQSSPRSKLGFGILSALKEPLSAHELMELSRKARLRHSTRVPESFSNSIYLSESQTLRTVFDLWRICSPSISPSGSIPMGPDIGDAIRSLTSELRKGGWDIELKDSGHCGGEGPGSEELALFLEGRGYLFTDIKSDSEYFFVLQDKIPIPMIQAGKTRTGNFLYVVDLAVFFRPLDKNSPPWNEPFTYHEFMELDPKIRKRYGIN